MPVYNRYFSWWMISHRIAADAVRNKANSGVRVSLLTGGPAHFSNAERRIASICTTASYRFRDSWSRGARDIYPGVMGIDRTRRSKITGDTIADRVNCAREIVSRRDRNYPSRSLVGNISAGWHAHWHTDAVRWTEDAYLGIYIYIYIVCTFLLTRRGLLPQVNRRVASGPAIGALWHWDTYSPQHGP